MKQKLLNSLRLRVCALVALLLCATGSAWAVSAGDTFTRISSIAELSDGDEVIFVNSTEAYACGTTQNTNNRTPVSITTSDHSYTYAAKDNVQVFVVKINPGANGAQDTYGFHTGSGYIYSASNSKNYLRTNTTKSSTVPSGTEAWKLSISSNTVTATNVTNTSYYLAFNMGTTSYFSQYSSGMTKPYIYKKRAASATALAVKTAPTKLNYKVGETLDLTGLVLDATVGGNHVDVTSGYTASPANGATLGEVGAKTVTFTYGGQTATQTIHVGELKGIEVTTNPTKTTYDEGQTFDPSGMVVTATYGDKETSETTWTETVPLKDGDDDGYTYSPDDELETTDDAITVSYTWDEQTKTDDVAITVNAASAYTVTFNAGSGSCVTSSLTEASAKAGVTLPTATIGVTGWSFAGWATASTTNTEVAPTLYAASSTYKPSDNVTLYAVYKFTEGTEGEYIRVTKLADVKAASKVILVNGGKTLTTDLSSKDALSESEGVVTAADKTVFTLSGNDTDGYTLTGASGTIGAASLPTSNGNNTSLSITSSNSTWSITTNSSTDNTFTFLNKGGTNVGLEYYSSGSAWVVYKTSSPTSSSYYATKVYVPNFAIVYNSNPAAMINPSVAFTTAGNKSLYVQDEASYTNAANVTGIAKTATYTSSDETVATVTSAGVVTALKAGSTTITAKVAKEVGVNSEASASYTVTVKDAKTIAGLKAIDNTSGKSFVADLTDAVVTYVKDNYAYIQDESAAIMVNFASHGLTAGKKINGAISGTVKITNSIDQFTALTLTEATVTEDGVIPDAAVVTLATIKNAGTEYDGKLVSVSGATVTGSIATSASSGASIKDGSKIESVDVSMNLYAPNQGVEIKAAEEGTFSGFISLYNGSTYRLNIFEQSQITLTKNAPTDQELTFASDAVELDEDTDDYDDFTGQVVSGAQGTVTYSIDSDDDGVVTSINASTGAVVLSGNYGTATIKASAAAKEVTVAGVITPYRATTKTYTVTVYPRYTVTFYVNGKEIELREASHGAGVAVPSTPTLPLYTFRGWNTSAVVAATDTKPAGLTDLDATIYPEDNDDEYYAVYAIAAGTPLVEHTSTFTVKQSSAPSSPYVNDGSSWTWSSLTFANDQSACIDADGGSVTFTLPSGGKAVSLKITKTSNTWAGAAEVVLKDASSNTLNTYSLGSNASATYEFTSSYDHSASYTLSNSTEKNAWTDNIEFKYTTGGVTYSSYTTKVASVAVGSAGFTTYVPKYDISIPSSVKAYIATATSSSSVELTEVVDAPSGAALIIKADEGAYAMEFDYAGLYDDQVALTPNLLQASDGSVTGDASTIYALGVGKTGVNKDKVGFYLVKNGVTVPAGKVYLEVTGGGDVKEFLTFDFGDADGINGLTPNPSPVSEGSIYNLAGQRLQKLQRGINIVNGKKVLVK